MHEPVGIAVVGCGAFARHQHLPNILRLPQARLVGLYNRNAERLQRVASEYPAALVTSDYNELLADERVEAVVIAAADAVQAPLTLAALAAGKHVYVEKPLAETPAICAEVEAAARRAKRVIAVGFNRRFAPALRDARMILQRHGGWRHIHYRMVDDARWRWGKDLPAGSLIVHDLCHIFDALRWLSGREVVSVACLSSRDDEDTVMLRFEDGRVATCLISGQVSMDIPKERMEVMAEHGALTMDDFVELKTYGWLDEEPCQCYPGHSHPRAEFTHRHLFARLGSAANEAHRRNVLHMRQEVAANTVDPRERAEVERFVGTTLPVFAVDKGWYQAMADFVHAVRGHGDGQHAGPQDALMASRIAAAAVASRSEQGAWIDPQAFPTSQPGS